MWVTKSVADDVGRKAVVLGHVADELPDRRALRAHVEAHDRRVAGRRLEEPEQDLDERALAGAIGADQADDPGLQLEGQAVERDDAARVVPGQAGQGDETHGPVKGTRRASGHAGGAAVGSPRRAASAEPEAVDDRGCRRQEGLQVRAVGRLDRDDERSVLGRQRRRPAWSGGARGSRSGRRWRREPVVPGWSATGRRSWRDACRRVRPMASWRPRRRS